jgi:hypothetical protein|tara:strand:- start:1968 stop:2819 length:852 start_codon:yes stop_codon:yes gene_type:complete
MSRNQERMGMPDLQDGGSPAPTQSSGAQMEWSVPTEMVDLPSKGNDYQGPHPLAGVEQVEIRFMTAKEEDILTSRSLLKSGMALNRLVDSLVVDKRVKASDLLIGDRNAILVAARITGYGKEYDVRMTCPACSAANEMVYNIDEIIKLKYQDLEGSDVSKNSTNGYYVTTLPKSGYLVEFKLLTAADEMKATKSREQKSKHKLGETLSTDLLRSVLVSVNGSSSPVDLSKAIQSMPALDARHIRKAYKEACPDVSLKDYYVCTDCGHDEEMEIPLSAEFFWPE